MPTDEFTDSDIAGDGGLMINWVEARAARPRVTQLLPGDSPFDILSPGLRERDGMGSTCRALAIGFTVVVLGFAGGCSSTSTEDDGASAETAGPIRLIGVGDTMMGTNFPDESYLNPELTEDADLGVILGRPLLKLLRSGDLVFGNMEGALYDGEGESKECKNPKKCYAFRSPEFHAGLLRDMGFNAMSLANNHGGDFFEAGRLATMAALARNGIAYAGVDMPGAETSVFTLKNGVRVGFAAFAPNRGAIGLNDYARADAIIRDLNERSDIVLVSFHGGGEGADWTHVPRQMEVFVGEERGDVYDFAHRAIDSGADVVLGHGPHVPRAVEVYRGRFIAYSLGNFWTYGRFNMAGAAGIAPVVDLRLAADGRLLEAKIHSTRLAGRGVPQIDESGAALRLIEALTNQDFPESRLKFAPDGTISGFGEIDPLLQDADFDDGGAGV